MKTRKIIGNILLLIAIAFTVYLSVIMIHRINTVVQRTDTIKIFCYELVVCVFFILLAVDIRFGFTSIKNKVLKVLGWFLRIIVVIVSAVFLFFIVKITAQSLINTAAPARYAIVLGLALENGKPTNDLISRLDTAEKYLEDNPDSVLILTGGNPDESGITEAAVMCDYLSDHGVPKEKMVLEDQAKSTKENFANTALMVDVNEAVVLISSNYHMDRAAQMAREAGFANVLRLPAPSSVLHFGANVMHEMIMEINELTLKQ